MMLPVWAAAGGDAVPGEVSPHRTRPRVESAGSLKAELGKSLNRLREGQEVSAALGLNSLETFGRTPFLDVRYNFFFVEKPWFAELALGAGGWKFRDTQAPIIQGELYRNDWVFGVDALFAYAFGGGRPGSETIVPYLAAGPGLVYQGGFFNPAAVVGFGMLARPKKLKRVGFRYGIRNRAYFPKVYSTDFITYNYHMYIGLQFLLKS